MLFPALFPVLRSCALSLYCSISLALTRSFSHTLLLLFSHNSSVFLFLLYSYCCFLSLSFLHTLCLSHTLALSHILHCTHLLWCICSCTITPMPFLKPDVSYRSTHVHLTCSLSCMPTLSLCLFLILSHVNVFFLSCLLFTAYGHNPSNAHSPSQNLTLSHSSSCTFLTPVSSHIHVMLHAFL